MRVGRGPLSPLVLEDLQDRLFQRARDTQRDDAELVLSLQSLQVRAFDVRISLHQVIRCILERRDQVRREILTSLNQCRVTTEVRSVRT